MDLSLQQLMATSALIVTLERICSRGILPLEEEIETRRLIVRAGRAFNLDSVAERPSADVILNEDDAEYWRSVGAVAQEMGA